MIGRDFPSKVKNSRENPLFVEFTKYGDEKEKRKKRGKG